MTYVERVIEYLEGLPEERYDCACLVVTTLLKTLKASREYQP